MENYFRKSKNDQEIKFYCVCKQFWFLGSPGFILEKFKWEKVIEIQCHLYKRTQYKRMCKDFEHLDFK